MPYVTVGALGEGNSSKLVDSCSSPFPCSAALSEGSGRTSTTRWAYAIGMEFGTRSRIAGRPWALRVEWVQAQRKTVLNSLTPTLTPGGGGAPRPWAYPAEVSTSLATGMLRVLFDLPVEEIVTRRASDCVRERAMLMSAFVVLVVLLVGAPSASAQAVTRSAQVVPPARPLPAFAQLQSWIQLSKTHRVGEVDNAVRTLATWPVAQIQGIDSDLRAVQSLIDQEMPVVASALSAGRTLTVKDLPALFDLPLDLFLSQGQPMGTQAIRKPDSAPRQAIARILLRAAMLHTDFLTAASREDMAGASASAGSAAATTIRLNDAERRHVSDLGIYWSCARTAMDLAEPTPVGGMLVHDWYAATAEYLVSQRDYAAGVPHVEHAQRTLPGEARIALCLGAAYENLASPAIQAAFQHGQSGLAIGSRPGSAAEG